MSGEAILEQRLANLERLVAEMQHQLVGLSAPSNWIEKVAGSISDETAFLEALEYGRAIRQTDLVRYF